MRDPGSNLSLMEFLAYLFPGVVMSMAIATLLLLTPLAQWVRSLPLNFVTGFIGTAIAYFLGVLVSSYTISFEERIYRKNDPLKTIPLKGYETDVLHVFNTFYGNHGPWDKEHFYLSRVLIRELALQNAMAAERQNAIYQLRRNSLLPVLAWGVTGVLWGTKIALTPSFDCGQWWGIGLILVSIVGTITIRSKLIVIGLLRNRQREASEICRALLSLPKILKNKAAGTPQGASTAEASEN